MNRIVVVVFFIIAIVFSSCKTQQATVKNSIKDIDVDVLFNKMKENELQFQTLSFKAEINAKINRKKSGFGATVRMQRDSMIWISVTPGLGLEAARILITQDSLFFMNRINKEYVCSDFSYISQRFKVDVDFNMLQSLLLGNDFGDYENDQFKTAFDAGSYRLNAAERSKQKKFIRNNDDAQRILVQSVWLDPDNYKINQIRIKNLLDDTRKLEAFYSDFEAADQQLLTTHVVFEIVAKGTVTNKKDNEEKMENQRFLIELNLSKIEVNQSITMPFTIPSKYQKMAI